MYDRYIVKRTQIYLDDAQDARLSRLAASAGVTKSNLIREAIDTFLEQPRAPENRLTRFRAALEEVERNPVRSLPAGASYVDDLRRADRERQDELERRRGA
jgi:predicted transcriptional regulator